MKETIYNGGLVSILTHVPRNVATKMAAKTVTWLIEQLNTCAARDGQYKFLQNI